MTEIEMNFYPSKNWLFWIYKKENEYYLIDVLPHPILILMGLYRSLIFKVKGRKINSEELEKYQRDNHIKSDRNKRIITVSGCAGVSLIAGNILDFMKKSSLVFNKYIPLGTAVITFCILIPFLYWYRRRDGLHKFKYEDVKIKVVRKKGIRNRVFCSLMYLISISPVWFFAHMIQDCIMRGYTELIDLWIIFACEFVIILFSFFQSIPLTYTSLQLILIGKKAK